MEGLFEVGHHVGSEGVVQGAGNRAGTGTVGVALFLELLGKVHACGVRVGVLGKKGLKCVNAPGRYSKWENGRGRASVAFICTSVQLVKEKRWLWVLWGLLVR